MLEAFDLDPLEEALYLALVDSPSCTVDELARLADTTGDRATGILDRLERAGLITRLPGVPTGTARSNPASVWPPWWPTRTSWSAGRRNRRSGPGPPRTSSPSGSACAAPGTRST